MIDKKVEELVRGTITEFYGNYEVVIKLDDGTTRVFRDVILRGDSGFRVGQRVVYVIQSWYRPADYDDVDEYAQYSLFINPGEQIYECEAVLYDELTYDQQNQSQSKK